MRGCGSSARAGVDGPRMPSSEARLSMSPGSSVKSRGRPPSPPSPSLYRKDFTRVTDEVANLTPMHSSILFKARLITKGLYCCILLQKSSSMKSCTMKGLNTMSTQKVVCFAPSARTLSFLNEPMSKGTFMLPMPCVRIQSRETGFPEYAKGMSIILCLHMLRNQRLGGVLQLSACKQKPTPRTNGGAGAISMAGPGAGGRGRCNARPKSSGNA
mmetsp:Transcript_23592/g.52275  ORF Transcript_23592/g.52275 Transcript_23592/m.52275 type:complete len:214 (-) Transcript_23592:7-648(-)